MLFSVAVRNFIKKRLLEPRVKILWNACLRKHQSLCWQLLCQWPLATILAYCRCISVFFEVTKSSHFLVKEIWTGSDGNDELHADNELAYDLQDLRGWEAGALSHEASCHVMSTGNFSESAYRAKHSTETVMLKVVNVIVTFAWYQLTTVLLTLDIWVDTINRSILLGGILLHRISH